MDKHLAIDCIKKRYEHEPCLTQAERERHIAVEIERLMREKPTNIIADALAEERQQQRGRE